MGRVLGVPEQIIMGEAHVYIVYTYKISCSTKQLFSLFCLGFSFFFSSKVLKLKSNCSQGVWVEKSAAVSNLEGILA